ncbi:hypothetical protein F5I97DRAFT_826612 [Phlebopus sp. FC_14]|nr:hypothetical protein F5I97DRAFT_826612 [Phlebopus sp. FC_14]
MYHPIPRPRISSVTMDMDTRDWTDISLIGGNTSTQLKQSLIDLVSQEAKEARAKGIRGYEPEIASRLVWKEVSILQKAEEPERLEGRVVFETTVQDGKSSSSIFWSPRTSLRDLTRFYVALDMLNTGGILHGACSAMFIGSCTGLPLALLSLATTGKAELGVSLSINVVYHAPARLGDKLRIVATTMSLGSRALSCRCEIWDVGHHRLVASGVHTKMTVSPPKSLSSRL